MSIQVEVQNAKPPATEDVEEKSTEITNCQSVAQEVEELLGSVTNRRCPGVRTSARFIQKMRQDQPRPTTPPNGREQRREERLHKTPSQLRSTKSLWTNIERNHFFDALHEFGKDFEAIGNYINSKLKRRSSSDTGYKAKDQVRQHYYQTFHKLCKYIKFSDEIKKPAQELYALINYGEMRRKLQFVPDKHLMKLKHLVYQGYTTVRCKGKCIRIKTPSCKALRRLNQLDESLDDIKLPAKIDVIISPANMEAFGRVQTIAQNPRVRTTVPLHKKLINFIQTFAHKWRSADTKLCEEEAKLFPANTESIEESTSNPPTTNTHREGELCFLPKPGVTVHRPLLSITEYLSSGNICLTAYENRMGVKLRGETLLQERPLVTAKRFRTDSGSEKRSPELKKIKQLQSPNDNNNLLDVKEENADSSCDELSDEINELLSEKELEALDEQPVIPTNAQTSVEVRPNKRQNTTAPKTYKTLLTEDSIKRIRRGWTVSTAADITVGDLYVVLGQESRLELEYYWKPMATTATTTTAVTSTLERQHGLPYNPQDCDNIELMKSLATSTISNKLKHLLIIANLNERIRKKPCSCGHACERISNKTKFERSWTPKTFLSNKTFNGRGKMTVDNTEQSVFRQPMAPIRKPLYNLDPVKQLQMLKFTTKNQRVSKQILVQRTLLPSGSNQTVDTVDNSNTTVKVLDSMPLLDEDSIQELPEPNKTNTQVPSNNTKTTKSLETAENNIENSINKPPTNFSGTLLIDNTDNDTNHSDFIANLVANVTDTSSSSSSTPISTLPDSGFDEGSSTVSLFNTVMSPMHLLKESSSNSRWLEENLNDFSLTSLLGHLDEINNGRDILDPTCNMSVISESSVDYRQKFQEIALMHNQDKD